MKNVKIDVAKVKTVPRFREYLARKLLGQRVKWEGNGENVAPWDGKNRQKREERRARKVDRLAHIRWNHGMHGNGGRTPKLKRVPPHVFE